MPVPFVPGLFMGYLPFRGEVAKTADYTLTARDSGNLFTNTGASGAVTFTLPTIAPNLFFAFRVVADQTVTIASAGSNDNIVAYNDASADSVAFSTSSQKVGGGVILHSNQAGTKWYVTNISAGANTITVA